MAERDLYDECFESIADVSNEEFVIALAAWHKLMLQATTPMETEMAKQGYLTQQRFIIMVCKLKKLLGLSTVYDTDRLTERVKQARVPGTGEVN